MPQAAPFVPPPEVVTGSVAPWHTPAYPLPPDVGVPHANGKVGHTGYTKQSGVTSKPTVGCFNQDISPHQCVLEQDTDLGLKASPSATRQSPFNSSTVQYFNRYFNGCSAVLLTSHLNVQYNRLLTTSAFN